ncbi:MAG: TetR/AcrR family transcriptional regulator [Lachnospiraceae bacterium]
MKPNQRIMLTKQLVHREFLLLMKKKSIHQISIRELCEKAGINRTTFYNHYGSQYDVLTEIGDWYLADIAQTIEETDVQSKDSVYSKVALVLQYVLDNLELSSMLINNGIDETFAVRLFSLPKIEEMLNDSLMGVENEKEKAAMIAFAISGSYKLVQDWINDENRIPPMEEAQLILTLAGRVCRWME